MSLRRIVAVILAVLAGLTCVAVSAVPIAVNGNAHESMIRVAFSARPQRIETCRELSEEELQGVPAHMRQTVVCEGITASYLLQVLHNDSLLDEAELHGGGLRRDRQLYVMRELHVPAGRGTIEVRLTRTTSAPEGQDSVGLGSRVGQERHRRMEDEVPAFLSLRDTMTLVPGEVLLVTYDQARRVLRTVRGAP